MKHLNIIALFPEYPPEGLERAPLSCAKHNYRVCIFKQE